MITKWKVKNFKSIRNEEELEIGPLTVFTGANSSGKSTIIQSILLIAQTIIHRQIAFQSLVMNGSLIGLGQFNDIKNEGSRSKSIGIKCTCRPLEDRFSGRMRRPPYYGPRYIRFNEISCDISFSSHESHLPNDLAQIRPQILSSRISCNYNKVDSQPRFLFMDKDLDLYDTRSDKHNSADAYILIQNPSSPNSKISRELESVNRESLACDVKMDRKSKRDIIRVHSTAEPIGCIVGHFIPEYLICKIDEAKESSESISTTLQENFLRRNFDYRFTMYFDEIVSALKKLLKDEDIDVSEIFRVKKSFDDISYKERRYIQRSLSKIEHKSIFETIKSEISNARSSIDSALHEIQTPAAIYLAGDYIDGFFSNSFKYLGPLRDAPRSRYPLSPSTEPSDVGLRGEHTAAVIDLHKKTMVDYIPPSHFKGEKINLKPVSRTLNEALSDWLGYLEIAKSVESVHLGKQGHTMKVGVSNPKKMHELTHVGVGVSQVLPILVMGLLSSPDTTLVFEQPELHLHPNVQILLGDFFLSMALRGKQCIVESHSEHLIDRIRFRIASSSSDEGIKELTKVYFVTKSDEVSSFEEIKIDDYGSIVNWPKGFFDQSYNVASDIMKAVAKKRKSRRS